MYSLFVLAVIVVVFWSLRSAAFLRWDDGQLVYENPFYVLPHASSLFYFWQRPYLNLYMPVTYTLWGIVANLTMTRNEAGDIGLDPTVFHSVSLLFHAANALLVFALLRRLLRAPFIFGATDEPAAGTDEILKDSAALVGTLLFALHPLQVETAAWISELKGVLAAFFCLAALVLFCRFLNETKPREGGVQKSCSRTRIIWLGGTLCFTAALLSKPSVVGLPLIALALAYFLWKRSIRACIQVLWPWFAMAAVMALAMTRIQPAGLSLQQTPTGLRFLVASDALNFYLRKLVFPVDLTINYSRTPSWLGQQPWAFATLLVPLILGVIMWRAWQNRPLIVAFVWVFVALLPNLGFVSFLYQAYSTVADRYFYFAMVGPSLLLSATLVTISYRRPRLGSAPAWILCAVALCGLGFLSRRQAGMWRDDRTLYTYALGVNPRDWGSLTNLGNVYSEENEYDAAMKVFGESTVYRPNNSAAYFGMAIIERRRKHFDKALHSYALALDYDPTMTDARLDLSTLLASRGNNKEALRQLAVVIRGQEKKALANVYAGQILLKQGDLPDAEKYARQAIEADDEFALAHLLLGVIYLQRNDKRTAMREYGRALELDPGSAQARIHVSLLLLDAGLRPQALQNLKEGIQIAPDDVALNRELKRVEGLN